MRKEVLVNLVLGILLLAVATYAIVDRVQDKYGGLDCGEMNMFKTVRCINKYVNVNLDYKISDDSINLNDTKLLEFLRYKKTLRDLPANLNSLEDIKNMTYPDEPSEK